MNQSQFDNPPPLLSTLAQKKQGFRKQIRKQKIFQEIASKRKMLFREHTAQMLNPSPNNFARLNSWQQVQHELNAFMPNYQSIHLYVYQHKNQQIPEDIQQQLISLVHRPDFLTNQDSLALLITLALSIDNEESPIFSEGTIKLIVDNLIKWSIVQVEQNGILRERVNYFETVCWTLFVLVRICENVDETFETLKQKINVFETSSPAPVCFQQLALFSELSTSPSFLPSSKFISATIYNCIKFQSSENKILIQIVVPLFDNFMRYKQQNPHRFLQKQDNEITSLYIEFIYVKLYDMTFPKSKKVELIELLTTLLNSASEKTLEAMFKATTASNLVGLIFYIAEYESWQIKRASLAFIVAMMINQTMLPYLNKRINPSSITYVCINSLLLPDPQIQKGVATALLCGCSLAPQIYYRQIKKHNLSRVIAQLEHLEGKSVDHNDQEVRLSDFLRTIDKNMKLFEQSMNQKGNFQENNNYHDVHKDIEI